MLEDIGHHSAFEGNRVQGRSLKIFASIGLAVGGFLVWPGRCFPRVVCLLGLFAAAMTLLKANELQN